MKETRRVIIEIIEAEESDHRSICRVRANGGTLHPYEETLKVLLGTSEAGTYDVTVEKVEPTWPMVRIENGIAWCSHCARYACRTNTPCFKCPICGVALSGEVPQSKVADFLRQDGE